MTKEKTFLILGWIAVILELISVFLIPIHGIFFGFTILFMVIAISYFVVNIVKVKEEKIEE